MAVQSLCKTEANAIVAAQFLLAIRSQHRTTLSHKSEVKSKLRVIPKSLFTRGDEPLRISVARGVGVQCILTKLSDVVRQSLTKKREESFHDNRNCCCY